MIINTYKYISYFGLSILAAFLTYWITQEYQKEKEAIRKDLYLDVAAQIIKLKGGDFFSIIENIEEENGLANIQISLDSVWENGSRNIIGDSMIQSKFIIGSDKNLDSAFNGHILQSVQWDERNIMADSNSRMSIIYSSNVDTIFSDSMSITLTNSTLDSRHAPHEIEESEDIAAQALKNIIPQILFALFLFGVLFGGLILYQRTIERERQFLIEKNNFMSNMTHELKTPIATISVALEAIQKFNIRDDKEKTNLYLNQSQNELNKLSSIIDELMLLNQLGDKSSVISFEKINISELINNLVKDFKIRAEQKDMLLLHQVESKDIFAEVDKKHFAHTISNLLDNAIKYSNEGGEIKLSLWSLPHNIEIQIQDKGIGIAKHDQDKIFNKFFRVSNGYTHDVKGNGLGLSYVSEIIKLHKGTISVQSEPNVGSTFNIVIPKQQTHG